MKANDKVENSQVMLDISCIPLNRENEEGKPSKLDLD